MVERKNRTTVAMAIILQKEKQLPANLWGETTRRSFYVLYSLPTRAQSGKTLYEARTENKPYIGHNRVFGCSPYETTKCSIKKT